MLKNAGIRTKLLTAFIGLALIPVLVGGIAFYYSSMTAGLYSVMVHENIPNLNEFIKMADARKSAMIPVFALVGVDTTPQQATEAKADFDKQDQLFEAAAKAYLAFPFIAGEEEAWNDFYKSGWTKVKELSLEACRLAGTNNKADFKARDKIIENDLQKARVAEEDKFEKLKSFQINEVKRKSDAGDALVHQMNFIIIAVACIGFALALFLGLVMSKSLSSVLLNIVKKLSDSSEQVGSASAQVASSSEQLSQSATEQASSLEETAASVEEMNSMIMKNSENAKSTEETSNQSQEAATKGQKVIERMMEAMKSINHSSEEMSEIVKVIEQIDKKTKVINEIVNKTELLSFNASVEAARAGEHGKGFAVVAEEVGNLARMSGVAAEEITTLLEQSANKVKTLVEETKKNVETGNQITQECGEVFQEVVKGVNKVSSMATEITQASQEQSRGSAEITKAMGQLDQVTQQNASAAEESASAAEELSAQAETLKSVVKQLALTVTGAGGTQISETLAHSTTEIATSNNKVLPIKGHRILKKSLALKNDIPLKKASGAPPRFDDDGFKNI